MSKKVIEVKTVKLKIAGYKMTNYLAIMNSGTEVEMNEKDENYIKKAFTQFERAQKILEKYFLNNINSN